MSIRIGSDTSSTTQRERIILHSSTESNMILMRGPNGKAHIVINDRLLLGDNDGTFSCSMNGQPLFNMSETNTVFNTPVTMASTFQIDATQLISLARLATCNLAIEVPPDTSNTYIRAYKSDGTNLLTASRSGIVYVNGNLGIGTSTPSKPLYVNGDSWINGKCFLDQVQSVTNSGNGINFDDAFRYISVRGQTRFLNDVDIPNSTLTVSNLLAGRFAPESITIDKQATVNVLSVRNTAGLNVPTIKVVQLTTQPIIDISLASSSQALYMSHQGYLGIGTSNPDALIDICANPEKRETLHIQGINNVSSNVLCIDNNANLSIGTSNCMHKLHIERGIDQDVNALVGLYDNSATGLNPIIQASSNGTGTFYLSPNGRITLGNIPYQSAWNIDAESNIRTPLLQVEKIYGNQLTSAVSLEGYALCNVRHLVSKDLTVTSLASTSNLTTNYFFASNFSILGLDVFQPAGFFSITTPTFYFPGSNILMSKSQTNLYTDVVTAGKLRIDTDNYTDSVTAIGLHVYGASNSGMRVSSSREPYMYLRRANGALIDEATMAINTGSDFSIKYKRNDNVSVFNIIESTQNYMRLGLRTYIGNGGNVLINPPTSLINAPSSGSTLDMVGSLNVRSSDDTSVSVFYVHNANGNVGIGNTNPQYKLHVNGSQYIGTDAYVNGNIAIGTTNTGGYRLNIQGDINFTGNIYKNNTEYTVTNQWDTVATNVITYTGRVGVATASPVTHFHVGNTAYFQSNVGIGTSTPLAALHVKDATYLQGNVGIGTITPITPFHVANTAYFQANVGIGTSPQASFHVKDTAIFQGNVGVGTILPSTMFHVNGHALFTSNVTVNGLLTTQGSIASVSDRSLKNNLIVIDRPLEKLSKVSGYTYDRIDTKVRECGLVAQEVLDVLPEAVQPYGDLLTVSYGNLAALFVEGFKELQKEVNTLKQRIQDLESMRS